MNNKWISVKEDLPKEGGRYWCYLEHINSLSKSHFQWNCSYDAITKTFSDRSLNDGETVTYWQPLAKPPEEEPKDHIPDVGKMIKKEILKGYYWVKFYNHNNKYLMLYNGRHFVGTHGIDYPHDEIESYDYISSRSEAKESSKMIGEDEFAKFFGEIILGTHSNSEENFCIKHSQGTTDECIKIAKQYANTKLQKLEIANETLKGEYAGFLKGLLNHNLPDWLKQTISEKISSLK